MSVWSIVNNRYDPPETIMTENNGQDNGWAVWNVAQGKGLITAINQDNNSILDYTALGDDSRVWDYYTLDNQRLRTDVHNWEAFLLVARNYIDVVRGNLDARGVWFVNIHNFNERLRWNEEVNWFEYYTPE